MSVIDCHFHWYPRVLFEQLGRRTDCPRAEPCGHTYSYWYGDGRKATLRQDWNHHELEEGLAVTYAATGAETEVICTPGILAGILDQLPVAEGSKLATIHNTAVAEAQRDHPGKFHGTALVPLRDTDEALRLVDEAVNQLGLCGINLPAVSNGELIDVPRLEPFYSLVAELGVPLIVHPTDILYRDHFTEYNGAMFLTLGRILDSSLTILRLIFSGIMERHSRLRILHTQAGGLLPYQAGRIDKNVGSNKQIKSLPHRPSDYIKRLYVDTVAPEELTIRTAVEFYGAGNVLYGTDYPCWQPKAAIDTLRGAGLAPADVNRILTGNARQLFRLGDRSAKAVLEPAALGAQQA